MSKELIAQVGGAIEKMAPQFKAALPSHIPVKRFQRVALMAIQTDPELLKADRASLYQSCLRAAQDGLLPDKREAALVVYRTNVAKRGEAPRWENRVQYMPMVAGILKKVRNSGEIASITAQIVCKNDHFKYNPASDPVPDHQPDWFGDRGEIVGVYAVAKLKDGTHVVEVMSKREIEKVRESSRAKDGGPWTKWYEEMARKTVIRRLSKYLPQSTDRDALHDTVHADDELFHADDSTSGPVIDGTAENVGQTDEPKRRGRSRKMQAVIEQGNAAAEQQIRTDPENRAAPDDDPGELQYERDEEQPDDDDTVTDVDYEDVY